MCWQAGPCAFANESVRDRLFSLDSRPSRIGSSAWFLSSVFWVSPASRSLSEIKLRRLGQFLSAHVPSHFTTILYLISPSPSVSHLEKSHVLWHDGDDACAIKRAIKAREYVVSEERAGRNVLVRAAETGLVPPRVVVFVSLRAITQRRFWNML